MTATPATPAIDHPHVRSGHPDLAGEGSSAVTGVGVRPDGVSRHEHRQATAYGYMRVPRDVPDAKVMDLETRMRALAADRGWQLVMFFHEFDCGSRTAFCDLLHQLDSDGTRNVVIPTLRHLASSSRLQELMLQTLLSPSGDCEADDIDGGVLVLEFENTTWQTTHSVPVQNDTDAIPAARTPS